MAETTQNTNPVFDKILQQNRAQALHGASASKGLGTTLVDGPIYTGYDDPRMSLLTQSGWEQARRAIGGGLTLGALGAMKNTYQFAHDIGNFFETMFSSDKSMSDLLDMEQYSQSTIAKNLGEIIDEKREAFAIHKADPNDVFDWDDSGFYWQSVQGILDSAVQFALPGAGAVKAVGAIQKIPRLFSYFKKTEKLGQMLTASKSGQQIANSVGSGLLSNHIEGTSMASEIYNNTMKNFEKDIQKYRDSEGREGISLEEAKRRSAFSANSFREWNRLMFFTDAVQLHGLFKGKGFTRNLLDAKGFKESVGNLTKFNTKNPIYGFLKQGVTEAGEEIVQGISQRLHEDMAKGVDTPIGERLLDYVTDSELLYEGFLGFFGGGPQKIATQFAQEGDAVLTGKFFTKKYWNDKNAMYNQQQEIIKETNDYFKSELGRQMVGHNIAADAVIAGRPELGEIATNREFSRLATMHFEAGTTEVFEQHLDDIANNAEYRKENKYSDDDAANAKELLKELDRLEQQWMKTSRYAVDDKHQVRLFETNNIINSLEKLVGSQQEHIDKLTQNLNETIIDDAVEAANLKISNEKKDALRKILSIDEQGKLRAPVDELAEADLHPAHAKAVAEVFDTQSQVTDLKDQQAILDEMNSKLRDAKKDRANYNSFGYRKSYIEHKKRQEKRLKDKIKREEAAERKQRRADKKLKRAETSKKLKGKAKQLAKKGELKKEAKKIMDKAATKAKLAPENKKSEPLQTVDPATKQPVTPTQPTPNEYIGKERGTLLAERSKKEAVLSSSKPEEIMPVLDVLAEIGDALEELRAQPFQHSGKYEFAPPAHIKDALDEMINRSKRIILNEDTNEYELKDENGKVVRTYKRVSNVSNPDYDDSNKYAHHATQIGSALDLIARDFFSGNLKAWDTYLVADKFDKTKSYPVFKGKKEFEHYLHQLEDLKLVLKSKGQVIIDPGIVDGKTSEFKLADDENGVAGTVDLMTYDKEGNVYIYDLKSMRSNKLEGNDYYSRTHGRKKSDAETHQDQLSLYRILLANSTGLLAAELAVIPTVVGGYNPDGEVKVPSTVNILTKRFGPDVTSMVDFFVFMDPKDSVSGIELSPLRTFITTPPSTPIQVPPSTPQASEEEAEARADLAAVVGLTNKIDAELRKIDQDQEFHADAEEDLLEGLTKKEKEMLSKIRKKHSSFWVGSREELAKLVGTKQKKVDEFIEKLEQKGFLEFNDETVVLTLSDLPARFAARNGFSAIIEAAEDNFNGVIARIRKRLEKGEDYQVEFADLINFIQHQLEAVNSAISERQYDMYEMLYLHYVFVNKSRDFQKPQIPSYEEWLKQSIVPGADVKIDDQYDENTIDEVKNMSDFIKRFFELPDKKLGEQGTKAAVDKVAYLAREYFNEALTSEGFSAQEISDSLNEGKVHPDVFNRKKLLPGTKLKIKVNHNYTGVTKYHPELMGDLPTQETPQGRVVQWSDFIAKYPQGTLEYNMFVPLEIRTEDDRLIGWYHTVGFATKHTIKIKDGQTSDEAVEEAREAVIDARDIILNNLNSQGEFDAGGQLQIEETSIGQLLRPENKNRVRASEGIEEDLDIVVGRMTGQKASLRTGPSDKERVQQNRVHRMKGFKVIRGLTYLMFPVGTKEIKVGKKKTKRTVTTFAPVPLYKHKMGTTKANEEDQYSDIRSSIAKVIELFIDTSNENNMPLIREFEKQTGYNLRKWEHVKKYLEQFLYDRTIPAEYTEIIDFIKDSNLDDSKMVFALKFREDSNDKRAQLVLGSKLSADGSQFINLRRGDQFTEQHRALIEKHLKAMFFNTSLAAVKNNKPVFIIKKGKVEQIAKTYKEFVKSTSDVPFVGMKYTDENGETQHTYTAQRLLLMNSDSIMDYTAPETSATEAKQETVEQQRAKHELTYKPNRLKQKIDKYQFERIAKRLKELRSSDATLALYNQLVDVYRGIHDQIIIAKSHNVDVGNFISGDLETMVDPYMEEGLDVFTQEELTGLISYVQEYFAGTEKASLLDLIDYQNKIIRPAQDVAKAVETRHAYGIEFMDSLSYEAAKELSNLVSDMKKRYNENDEEIKPDDVGKLVMLMTKGLKTSISSANMTKLKTYLIDVIHDRAMSVEEIYTATESYTISPYGEEDIKAVEKEFKAEESTGAVSAVNPPSDEQEAADLAELDAIRAMFPNSDDESASLYGFTPAQQKFVDTHYVEGVDVLNQGAFIKNMLAELFDKVIYNPKGVKVKLEEYVPQLKYNTVNMRKDLRRKAAAIHEQIKSKYDADTYSMQQAAKDPDNAAQFSEILQLDARAKKLDLMIAGWDKIEGLLYERLTNTAGFKMSKDKSARKEVDLDTPAEHEGENVSSDEEMTESDFSKKKFDSLVGEVDPKASASPLLKMFLSTIPRSEIDPETGKAIGGFSWYKGTEYVDFDKVWGFLKETLANKWSDRKAMIEELENYTTSHPYVQHIIDLLQRDKTHAATLQPRILAELQNDPAYFTKYTNEQLEKMSWDRANYRVQKQMQLARQLIVAVRSTAINMYMVMAYSNLTGGDSYSRYKTIPANRNKVDKKVRDQWTINLKQTALYSPKSEFDATLYPNTSRIDALFNKYDNQYRKTLDHLVGFLSEIGVTLSDEVIADIIKWDGNIPLSGGEWVEAGELLSVLLSDKGLRPKMVNNLPLAASNPLNDGYIQSLSRLQAKHEQGLRPQSARINNKSIYEYTTTQFNADHLRELQEDGDMIANFSKSHFSAKSLWLQDSYDHTGGVMMIDEETGQPVSTGLGLHEMEFFTVSLNPYKEDWQTSSGNPVPLQDRNELQHELTKIAHFQEGFEGGSEFQTYEEGEPVRRRRTSLFYPTNSNKERATGFRGIKAIVSSFYGQENRIVLTDETLDVAMEQLVEPEFNRIVKIQSLIAAGDTPRIKAYAHGGQMFHFIPSLNNMEELWDEFGQLNTEALNDPKIQELVRDRVSKHLIKLGQKKYKFWKKAGIGATKEIETKSGNTIKKHFQGLDKFYMHKMFGANKNMTDQQRELAIQKAALDMEINYMIANANMYMLFIGDPALYFKPSMTKDLIKKYPDPIDFIRAYHSEVNDEYRINVVKDTFDNAGKRLAGDIAPGYELADTANPDFADDLEINYMFLGDVKIASVEKEYLKRLGLGDAYDGLEGADGQEYTHWSEHLKILYHLGRLTDDDYERITDKLDRGEDLNDSDLKTVLQPMKPVYVNNRWDEGLSTYIRTYVKTSAFPLLPQLTRDLEIDKLTQFLEERYQDPEALTIHRVPMMSGTKVGGFSDAVEFMNADGTFKTSEELAEAGAFNQDLHVITVPRQGFRIQQDVPYKEDKDEINRVSQAAKLLVVNMMGQKGFEPKRFIIDNRIYDLVPSIREFFIDDEGNEIDHDFSGEDMNKIYNAIFKYLYEEDMRGFVNEFMEENGEDLDWNKVKDVIRDEAIARNYPPTMVDAIDMFDDVAFLKFSPYALQFQALLNSIVNNRVLKKTMPGHSYVLGSEEGFRIQEGLTEDNLKNTEIIYTGSFNGKYLQPARYLTVENANEKEIADARKENRILKEEKDGVEVEYIVTEKGKKIMRGDQVFVAPRFKIEDKNGKERYIDLRETYSDGTYKWLNKDKNGRLTLKKSKFSKQALEMFGMRIPNQGPNSTAYIEIAGFLPKKMGDLIIAPRDFTARMGSDFDVDKLYCYQYYYSVNKSGKIVAYKGKNDKKRLKNALVNVHMTITSNPDENVQKAISTPLNEWRLGEIGNTILGFREKRFSERDPETGEVIPANESFSGISSEYQRTKYLNARAGKIGVGVFSQDSVFNAMLQQHRVTLMRQQTDDSWDDHFEKFGDQDSKLMYTTDTTDGTLTKMEVISAWQSAAVDDETLQILYKLNVNSTTMPVVRYMNQIGFVEETPWFLTQDAMFDYLDFLNQGMKRADAVSAVFKKYNIKFPDEAEKLKEFKNDLYEEANEIGLDKLKHMVENGPDSDDYTPEEYARIQGALFYKFLDFTKKGEDIGDLQRRLGRDTKTVGKNLIETLEILKPAENKSKMYKMANEEKLFNETIPGWIYMNALPLALKFDDIFQVQSPLIEEVYSFLDDAVRWTLPNDTREKIYKHMISYFFSLPKFGMFDGDVVSARERLFFDSRVTNGMLWDRMIEQQLQGLRDKISSRFVVGETTDNQAIEYVAASDTYIISSALDLNAVTSMMDRAAIFDEKSTKNSFIIKHWNKPTKKERNKAVNTDGKKGRLESTFNSDPTQLQKFVVAAKIYSLANQSEKIEAAHFKYALNNFIKLAQARDVNPVNNMSLASIFSNIMSHDYVRNNPFLIGMTADINEQGISKLTFNATEGTLMNERVYSEAFLNLFNDVRQPVLGVFNGIRYTPKLLGQELIKYAMLSGAKQEAIEFTKYIPPSILYNLPLASPDGRTIGDEVSNASLRDLDMFQNFKYQFLQHMSEHLIKVSSYSMDLDNYVKKGKKFNHKEDLLPAVIDKSRINFKDNDIKTEEGEFFIPHAFVTEEVATKKMVVYVSNRNNKYHKVDSLGVFGMREYDPSKQFAASTVNHAANTTTHVNFADNYSDDLVKWEKAQVLKPMEVEEFERLIDANLMSETATPSMAEVITATKKYTKFDFEKSMLETYAQMAILTGVEFSVNQPVEGTSRYDNETYYDPASNRVNINKDTLDKVTEILGSKGEAFKYLLMHELGHAFTKMFIHKHPSHRLTIQIKQLQQEFVRNLDKESDAWKELVEENAYIENTLTDIHEFIAYAMSDNKFQKVLAGMKRKNESMLNKFFRLIKGIIGDLARMLGVKINDTLLEITLTNVMQMQSLYAASVSDVDPDTGVSAFEQLTEGSNAGIVIYEMDGKMYEFTLDGVGVPISYRRGTDLTNLQSPRSYTGDRLVAKTKELYYDALKDGAMILGKTTESTQMSSEISKRPSIEETIAAMDRAGRIERDSEGNLTDVKALNGKSSKLFHSLTEIVPDAEQALREYANVTAYKGDWDQLELDSNGEPDLVELNDMDDVSFFAASSKGNKGGAVTYQFFIDSFNRRKIKLEREMNVLSKERDHHATAIDRKAFIELRVRQIQQAINILNGRIELLRPLTKIRSLKTELNKDVTILENLIGANKNPTLHDLELAREIIEFWKVVGNYSGEEHPFFDESELISIREQKPPKGKRMNAMQQERTKQTLDRAISNMQTYQGILLSRYKDIIDDRNKKTYGADHDINWNDFIKDVSGVEAQFLDISQTDNEVLHLLGEAVKDANWRAKVESNKIVAEVDEMLDKLRDWASTRDVSLNEAFESLAQTFSNDHDERTGNLVEFATYEWRKELLRKRRWAQRQGTIDARSAAEFSRFGTTGFETENVQIFDDSRYRVEQAYRDKMNDLFGEEVAQDLSNQARALRGEFRRAKDGFIRFLDGLTLTTEQRDLRMKMWEFENDPEVHRNILKHGYVNTIKANQIAKIKTGKKFKLRNEKNFLPIVSGKFVLTVPKSADHVDKNFKRLYKPENKPLLDMYKYAIDKINEINDYLPAYKTRNLQENTLPYMLQTHINEFWHDRKNHGMIHASKAIWDRFLVETRQSNFDEESFRMKDPNGQLSDEIQVRYIRGRKKIDDHIDFKVTEWLVNQGDRKKDDAYKKDLQEVRAAAEREIINKLSEKQSFDLGQVLKAYAIFGLNYKHKAATEDLVRAVGYVVDKSDEAPTLDGSAAPAGGRMRNIKTMVDSYKDSFFNYRPIDKNFVSKKKEVLTQDEKKEREEIKGLIDTLKDDIVQMGADMKNDKLTKKEKRALKNKIDDYEDRISRLEDQYARIGGKFKSASYIDLLLRYTRLKGMAWNVPAAFSNIAFGLVAGMNQAADGRVYGDNEYFTALSIALNGVGRNWSFGKKTILHKADVSEKIRNAMDHLDILKETKYEIFSKSKEGTRKWDDKIKFLDPYNPQARSEYFVQSIDLIATALATKVTLADGTETNLWHAMDNNLNVPVGATITTDAARDNITVTEDNQLDAQFYLKQRADKVIRENHGNYDPDYTIKAKRSVLGRMVSIFNTWLFEAVQQRFGRVRDDKQFGFKRKGRYHSGVAMPFLPVMFGWSNETGMGAIQQSLFATKYLWNQLGKSLSLGKLDINKQITGQELSFEEAGFSEVDAANMRRNIRDAQFQLLLIAMFYCFKAMATGDKEEREEEGIPSHEKGFGSEWMNNYMANMSLRIYNELTLYNNPVQIFSSPQNFATLGRTLADFGHLIDATFAQFGEKPNYEQGAFKGVNKLWVRSTGMIPGSTPFTSAIKSGHQIYGTPISSTLGTRMR